MKKQSKQKTNFRLNRLKQPRRQYSTLNQCQHLNQSIYAVFGLPVSVLEKHKELPSVSSQRQSIKTGQKSQPQGYGDFAINYQQNLRKTVLNHTKNLFKYRNKSFAQKVSLPTTIHVNNLSQSISGNQQQHHNQVNKTLSILQKVILKDADYVQPENKLVSLQANRLPMLVRKQSKKQRSKSNYLIKYKWQPRLNEQTYQNFKDIKYGSRKRDEKLGQICGWEHQQNTDF